MNEGQPKDSFEVNGGWSPPSPPKSPKSAIIQLIPVGESASRTAFSPKEDLFCLKCDQSAAEPLISAISASKVVTEAFFRYFGTLEADSAFGESPEAKLAFILGILSGRERLLLSLSRQTCQQQTELEECRSQSKEEKRKMVNLIISKDKELEGLRQSIEELKEGLLLRQEIVELKEANLRLHNTIESQNYTIERLKQANASRDNSAENSQLCSPPEYIDSLSRFSELNRKIDDLMAKRVESETQAESLSRKIKAVHLELKTSESRLAEITDLFRRERQRGFSTSSPEKNWKEDFDAGLQGIEKANKKVQTVKRTHAQLTQELRITEERIAQLANLINDLSAERNIVRNGLPNHLLSEGIAQIVKSKRNISQKKVLSAANDAGKSSPKMSPSNQLFRTTQLESSQKKKRDLILRKQLIDSETFEFIDEQTVCKNEFLKPVKSHRVAPSELRIKAVGCKLAILESRHSTAIKCAEKRVLQLVLKLQKMKGKLKTASSPLGSAKIGSLSNRQSDFRSRPKQGSMIETATKRVQQQVPLQFSPFEQIRIRSLLKQASPKDTLYESIMDKLQLPVIGEVALECPFTNVKIASLSRKQQPSVGAKSPNNQESQETNKQPLISNKFRSLRSSNRREMFLSFQEGP